MAQVRSPDVVIVGAGAVGAACAYHLAAAAMRVTVLEQDRVAAGSTTCASGGMYSISGDFNDADYLRWAVQGHYRRRRPSRSSRICPGSRPASSAARRCG